MFNSFIPNFHFEDNKLTPSWALSAVDYYFFNSHNTSLLAGKDVREIEGYASGDFDMTPYVKIFKSLRKDLAKKGKGFDSTTKEVIKQLNIGATMGLEFERVPLLPEKLNSAVAITSKIPVEVSVNAIDPLAIEKKQKDINFIKNKPLAEAQMQEVSDRLGLGEVDLGTTEFSDMPYSESPFGLDLNEPDELDIFVNLLYTLKVESAFETVLQSFYEIKNRKQIRLLEIKDQFKFGVSCHRAFQNKVTGLPDCEYVYPSEMYTPFSLLPDYSDNSHRYLKKRVPALDLLNYFGDDIKSKADLERIISAKGTGYCACNDIKDVPYENYNTFKVDLYYFEVKSVDSIGVAKSKSKKGYTTLTEDNDNTAEKIWAQNTYGFWWLANTKEVFGIERLGFGYRTKGKESYQNFSTNIYKSQDKSAVELSIGENKKAQIADIKLQHAVIMSLPAGRYIDLHFLRNAMSGLTDDEDEKTMNDLINLALERNIILGDTEGFNGKNDGQFKPVIDLPGGLKSEIIGYMQIIASANNNVSRITGINANLTGQKTEELIGLQELSIDSSINALYYCSEAIGEQDKKMFTMWANVIKQAVEEGGKPKEAIKSIIGSRKVAVIDGLDDIALHDMGIMVRVYSRKQERDFFYNLFARMVANNQLSPADQFMVLNIDNLKDQYAFLAVKEQKWKKEQAAQQAAAYQQQQLLVQQQGQNIVAGKQAEGQMDIQTVLAKIEGQKQVLQIAAALGVEAGKYEYYQKADLQSKRGQEQKDKLLSGIREKSNTEQQASLI